MKPNETFAVPANEQRLTTTINALKSKGIEVDAVDNEKKAYDLVLSIIPKQEEVFTMVSQTLELTGIAEAINESGEYDSVRKSFARMGKGDEDRKSKLGAAPRYAVGSVHAVTEKGEIFIASNTGSQLAAYAYGAKHVLYVVGTQKIVKDTDTAFKRIYEYSYPLENERSMKAYGRGSNVSKILIINKEQIKGRIRIIFIRKKIGF